MHARRVKQNAHHIVVGSQPPRSVSIETKICFKMLPFDFMLLLDLVSLATDNLLGAGCPQQ